MVAVITTRAWPLTCCCLHYSPPVSSGKTYQRQLITKQKPINCIWIKSVLYKIITQNSKKKKVISLYEIGPEHHFLLFEYCSWQNTCSEYIWLYNQSQASIELCHLHLSYVNRYICLVTSWEFPRLACWWIVPHKCVFLLHLWSFGQKVTFKRVSDSYTIKTMSWLASFLIGIVVTTNKKCWESFSVSSKKWVKQLRKECL